jgi:hypothetical protein
MRIVQKEREPMNQPMNQPANQNSTVLTDEINGGEYKIENGQEKVSLWLPISRAEKSQLVQRMQQQNTSMTEVLMQAIKEFR